MKNTLFCLFLFLLFSVGSIAVPGQVSFQGVLKDSAGNPITGTRTVDFAIYNSATGAGALWSETQTVSIEAGLYNVKLGSVTPLTASVFDGNTKYLAVLIGGSELTPRVVILTAPYAFRAEYADTAGSSGGFPNAVIFNPASKQTTTETNVIWLSTSASGTDAYNMKAAISAEVSGSQFNVAISGLATNPSATDTSIGVIGATGASSGANHFGVFGYSIGTGTTGVRGHSSGASAYGVYGQANDATSYGVFGRSNNGIGIGGRGALVGGSFEATAASGIGVRGSSASGTGVKGIGDGKGGEFSASSSLDGAAGVTGVAIATSGNVIGVMGESKSPDGYSGYFTGGLGVKIHTGSLEARSGLVITDAYTPSNGADPGGIAGNIQWDENFIYIKTAAGGWKRATLEAF